MHNVVVSISVADANKLEHMWNELYQQAKPNFFLSWSWIGVWFAKIKCKTYLCTASIDGKIVGLALLTEKTSYKHAIIPVKKLFLHKTGDSQEDQAWIEYNDFLLCEKHQNVVRLRMLDTICEKMQWDEFVVGASTQDTLAAFRLKDLKRNDTWVNQSYRTDLASIRDRGLTYLETLSKNTRYQINRSLRSYKKIGELNVEFADTAEQARAWFDDAGPLHIERWQETNVGSGYSNAFFVEFHHDIIKKSFAEGRIHLIKISAGDSVICYLYNFIDDKEVKFYLAATNFNHDDKTLKPGLVAHYLVIQEYLNKGFDIYDFMAGDSQYKRSLSSSSSQVALASFKRNSLYTQLETKLRGLKQNLSYSQNYESGCADVDFFLCGGQESHRGSSRMYGSAKILQCSIKNNELIVTNTLDYQTDVRQIHPNTNIMFKAGSIDKGALYVVTETEVLTVCNRTLAILDTVTHPSFNDLHHVITHKGTLYIANTGLDCVSIYNSKTHSLEHQPAIISAEHCRVEPDIDYRLIASTKPHFVHPNHLFVVDDEVWVTRCDTMDAVSINDHTRRIFIGEHLVHDGVVFKNRIYFTCVDGNIKVFDVATLAKVHDTNLNEFIPNINGWCRGIMPVSSNLVVVGLSKYRQSKRRAFSTQKSYARLVMIDIYKQQVIWDFDISRIGMDAIFSILPGKSI